MHLTTTKYCVMLPRHVRLQSWVYNCAADGEGAPQIDCHRAPREILRIVITVASREKIAHQNR